MRNGELKKQDLPERGSDVRVGGCAQRFPYRHDVIETTKYELMLKNQLKPDHQKKKKNICINLDWIKLGLIPVLLKVKKKKKKC